MKSLPAFLLSLVCAAPSAVAQVMHPLPAVESVSISRVSPHVFPDNRLRAYNFPASTYQDVVGLYKFDLSSISPTDEILGMRLILTMENAFNSPLNNPVVNLHYSSDDAWTRATATPTSGALGAIVTANQSGFMHPTHTFTIDLRRHDFRKDLADGAVTLVIDNVNPNYSYIYFYGHTGSPVGPNAVLEVTTAACRGTVKSFGAGGRDSRMFSVEAVTQGCPDLGRNLSVGAALGDQNPAPVLLFLGRSRTRWGSVNLPFDLTPLGAPGSQVYAALQFFGGIVPNPGGGGLLGLPIPRDNSLANSPLYFQCVVVDLTANAMGIVMTEGLETIFR